MLFRPKYETSPVHAVCSVSTSATPMLTPVIILSLLTLLVATESDPQE
jgi:hypothetical protein